MRFVELTMLSMIATFAMSATSQAAFVFSTGAGSAVSAVDRSATFDGVFDGQDLSAYSENGLSIAINDEALEGHNAFNDGTTLNFHYGSGGNFDYVTIKGTDGALFSGLEFKLGDGYQSVTTGLIYRALLNGVETASGYALLSKGTVVGFSDLIDGFDELHVAADISFTALSELGDFQAIALDNVNVQLFDSVAEVPAPASLILWSMGGGLTLIGQKLRRRRKTEQAA